MAIAKIRVLVIEEHGLLRAGVKLILDATPDIEVVAAVENGQDGLRAFERLAADDAPGGPVDVVVMNLSLPDIPGLELTRRLKHSRPGVRVLILTMYADDEHIQGIVEHGADGYLLKQAAAPELPAAIRAVAAGGLVLSPALTRRLMSHLRFGPTREQRATMLTERERQVLNLLAEGSTSKELAQRLGLSTKTIENHRARILEKLGVANTAAAIGLAAQHGLLSTDYI
ncbi:MAG TPA: response regulator transcription factor [Thermomicrobiales bacterium]|jgi:two-component system response regulator NreC|nr:response regulator transcription factor [Thermomicrobiales bacterium]